MNEKDRVDRLIEAVRVDLLIEAVWRGKPVREDDFPYLYAAMILLQSKIHGAQLTLDIIADARTKAILAHYGLPPSWPGAAGMTEERAAPQPTTLMTGPEP